METGSSQSSGNEGAAFLVGSLVTGGLALIHNISKDEQHKQDLQQVYSQGYWQGRADMNSVLAAKDVEIAHLNALLRQKDVELGRQVAQIAQLTNAVQSLSATMKAQELQMTAKIFPHDDNDVSIN